MKHILIEFQERNGEQEYSLHYVVTANKWQKPDAVANRVARNWYPDKPDASDGGFYFFNGCVHVSVTKVQVISDDERTTLLKLGIA